MKVVYPYDTTPFVQVAIDEVVKTLFEAILLVFLVMWLFMGNIRATLIPTIAVPVVLLGTFAVLGLFGFSINMLTMFAMVLAIGLLVDDAIVVVENVERIMAEEGLSPREATAKSMDQITSALIGIGLVLSAVFGPMAFFPGSTGVIYRQFSVTIIASMMLSVVVALILTPVLCASLLQPVAKGHEPAENAFFSSASVLPLVRPRLLLDPRPLRRLGRTLAVPRSCVTCSSTFCSWEWSASCTGGCPAPICRMKIKGCSCARSSCRPVPRWSRPRRSRTRSRAIFWRTKKRRSNPA